MSRQALRTPVAMSTFARGLSVLAMVAMTFGCGSSPIQPPPPPDPPPPNNLPVISSIKIQGTRRNEPASFADVGESVAVTADVKDDETPVSQLQFVWTAPVGTFTGTGASVTWQAPAQAANTPFDVALKLEVVERYGPVTAPTAFEHRVSSSETVKLHDSIKEVGDASRQFLLDFSDSSIRDVPYIMRNFEPGCYGTSDEAAQVADNRSGFQIVSSFVGPAAVTVNFGGVCSFRARAGDACAQVPVQWDSIKLPSRSSESVRGIDQVAAVFIRSRSEWRLCDSQFNGVVPFSMRGFIR